MAHDRFFGAVNRQEHCCVSILKKSSRWSSDNNRKSKTHAVHACAPYVVTASIRRTSILQLQANRPTYSLKRSRQDAHQPSNEAKKRDNCAVLLVYRSIICVTGTGAVLNIGDDTCPKIQNEIGPLTPKAWSTPSALSFGCHGVCQIACLSQSAYVYHHHHHSIRVLYICIGYLLERPVKN